MTRFGIVIALIGLSGLSGLSTGALAQGSKGRDGTAALQGTWAVTSLNGQAIPDGAPALTLTFSGNKYHQTLAGQVNERGTFKVDASKKPMTIDLAITEGDDAGKTQLGIVEVTGDTMRCNLDTPGAGQRPADFTVKNGVMFAGKKQKP